ncbi:long-chain acyl-CoA synthetase [Alkalibaculum bacchi]|uniref:Long-chain acyl-CoA synthetase n=1 Tax=Alkalibaculum bacchi TaxID=645887 RepID=A0A366IAX6_9FIRM|nr:AMP-binding protein [Alkalibaculum bacchi]RBP66013.1 long-chain acyl-CoA synthetase [Alkalibaculum bacchi]
MKSRIFYKPEKLNSTRELLSRSSSKYSEHIAFKEIGPNKQILEYSYKNLQEDVDAFGASLIEMGMKGYHFAILGENSYLWVVSYLAIIQGIGVAVPLDKELSEEDLFHLIKKSNTDAIICSKTYASIAQKCIDNNLKVKQIIVMNSEDHADFLSMKKLIQKGKEFIKDGDVDYTNTPIDVENMCEIIFTSGTTGPNKGVMLSQKNLMTVLYGSMTVIKAEGVSLSVLPIHHTYECSCHILGGLYSGITICFIDSLKRVVESMNLFKPNMSIMVPMFLEAIYNSIWRESKRQGLEKHLQYGVWFSNLIRKIRIDRRRKYFAPVLNRFGGNLQQIVCGGAPLSYEVVKGLTDLGIDILNGYGITECAPLVACNHLKWRKPGSLGRVMSNCKVRINNPDSQGKGEIQVKGDNVMLGYYDDPESTERSFTEDGWFKTGDLGYLDKDNFLYINGREKNLIILSNGKNVHPEELEEIIRRKLVYVKEVVVYSASSSDVGGECIAACVCPEEEYLHSMGIDEFKAQLNKDFKSLNRSLPAYKQINRIMFSEYEFEKTTSKKIKRNSIAERSYQSA